MCFPVFSMAFPWFSLGFSSLFARPSPRDLSGCPDTSQVRCPTVLLDVPLPLDLMEPDGLMAYAVYIYICTVYLGGGFKHGFYFSRWLKPPTRYQIYIYIDNIIYIYLLSYMLGSIAIRHILFVIIDDYIVI